MLETYGEKDLGEEAKDADFEEEGEEGLGGCRLRYAPFDPRQVPKRNNLVLAMGDENEGGMMDYFNMAFMKNRAEPER
ncbi:hypothetical protein PM082_010636 [Marasmius tenuissimus]|nr:hypothetical protein PM082_010636 [Marasmius tenuissimus]